MSEHRPASLFCKEPQEVINLVILHRDSFYTRKHGNVRMKFWLFQMKAATDIQYVRTRHTTNLLTSSGVSSSSKTNGPGTGEALRTNAAQ